MTTQLMLDGIDTRCCGHCRRLPDGRCQWLTETGRGTHIVNCGWCRLGRKARP